MTRRWRATALVAAWMTITTLPLMGIPVMVPGIAEDLNTSTNAASWVFLVFTLALAGTFVPASHVGNMLGHRRVATVGSLIEVVILVVIAFSPNIATLVALRFFEGIVRGMAVPNWQTAAIAAFSQQERGKPLGIIFGTISTATLFIPAIAGTITDVWGWRWVFLISAAGILLITSLSLLNSRGEETVKRERPQFKAFDLPGSMLLMLCAATFLVGVQMTRGGVSVLLPIALIATAVVFTVILVRYESRQERPALPVRMFKNRSFSIPNLSNLLFMFNNGVMIFILPIFMIEGLGWDAAYAGTVLIAMGAARPVASVLSGMLSDRIGPAPLVFIAASLVTTAVIGVAFGGNSGDLVLLLPFLVLLGFGQNMFGIANQKHMYSIVPQDQLALAPGALGLGRHIGQTSGAGIAAALYSSFLGPAEADPSGAFRLVMLVTVGVFVIGMLSAYLVPMAWGALRPSRAPIPETAPSTLRE